MSDEHRRYLLLEQGLGSAVFNFFLNAAIAAALFYRLDVVPLWGQMSIAGDTIGTTIILPLLTCLVVTRLANHRVASGGLPALGWTRTSHPVLGWLPRATFPRALAFAAGGLVLLAPISLWALMALDHGGMRYWPFVLFKASFAAVAAAVVTPIVALWAIAESA